MASSTAVQAGRKPLRLEGPNGARPRLLLAEDSDPVRIVTAAMLKGMGCDVKDVIHGELAVKHAAEQPFDVIVLDIEMPVMDGITAARSIRQLGGVASGTPLMALSAFLADTVRNGDWRDTFDIALPKPANKNELHQAISAALAWSKARLPGEADSSLPPLIDMAELAVMRSGIQDDIWNELRNLACRDIETCAAQLEHWARSAPEGPALTFVAKLAALGQTFAAPRLAALAEQAQRERPSAPRQDDVQRLLQGARDTVAAFRDSN